MAAKITDKELGVLYSVKAMPTKLHDVPHVLKYFLIS